MPAFESLPVALLGLVHLRPRVHEDARGALIETYSEAAFAEVGVGGRFVRDVESISHAGTIRGLHFADPPEAKLVRCASGRIWDVVCDLRPESPTLGRWAAFELSADNHEILYVPPGFAHGFAALSEPAVVAYKLDRAFDPGAARGIRFDDPDLAVDWRIEPKLVSAGDRAAPSFKEYLALKRSAARGSGR